MSDYNRGDWVTLAICGYCRNWQVDGWITVERLVVDALAEHQRECRRYERREAQR